MLFLFEILRNLLHGVTLGAANLPVLALVALFVDAKSGKGNNYFFLSTIIKVCIFLSCLGLFDFYAEPFLLFSKFQAQGISPRIPNFFESGMLPYSMSTLLWLLGIFVLFFARRLCLQRVTVPSLLSQRHRIQIALCVALCLFWATCITLSWPYAGKPESISTLYLLLLLMQQSLHEFFSAFVPGGIFTLLVLWFLSSPKKFLQSNSQIFSQRMCAIWLFIGLIPDGILNLGKLLQTIFSAQEQISPKVYISPLLLIVMIFCFSTLLTSREKKYFLVLPSTGIGIYCIWLNLHLLVRFF